MAVGKNFSIIKNRTLADVERVKELFSKKYQNMTAAEKAEWDGTMIGRFNYQDMNRLCGYINTIRYNIRALVYGNTGSYPSASVLPADLPTNWTINDTPASSDFDNMIKIINYTLEYLGYSKISLAKYDFSNFNNLEKNIEDLDAWIELWGTEETTTPEIYGLAAISATSPYINFNGAGNINYKYRVVLHSRILPCSTSQYDSTPVQFLHAKVLDFRDGWGKSDNTQSLNNISNFNKYFYGNNELEKLFLPEGRLTRFDWGFADSNTSYPKLNEINGERIGYIYGGSIFKNCTELKTINLINLISTSITAQCFNNCTSLSKVILPSVITSIEERAFMNCTSLKEITFLGTMAQWNSISKYTGAGGAWNVGSAIEKIICSDGIINI